METPKKCTKCGKPLRYEWEIEIEICEDCQIRNKEKTIKNNFHVSLSIAVFLSNKNNFINKNIGRRC